jgi:hypothetical protein
MNSQTCLIVYKDYLLHVRSLVHTIFCSSPVMIFNMEPTHARAGVPNHVIWTIRLLSVFATTLPRAVNGIEVQYVSELLRHTRHTH